MVHRAANTVHRAANTGCCGAKVDLYRNYLLTPPDPVLTSRAWLGRKAIAASEKPEKPKPPNP
jgi:hypothetical protein